MSYFQGIFYLIIHCAVVKPNPWLFFQNIIQFVRNNANQALANITTIIQTVKTIIEDQPIYPAYIQDARKVILDYS